MFHSVICSDGVRCVVSYSDGLYEWIKLDYYNLEETIINNIIKLCQKKEKQFISALPT